MKYRTKLHLALAGTALFSSLCGFWVLFYEFRHHAYNDQQSKALTVAATTAALIDPELLKQINTRQDEKTPVFKTLKGEFLKARDANRRQDIHIRYLYAVKPNPSNPDQFIYVVDAEEDPRNVSHAGDVDESSLTNQVTYRLDDYYSPPQFIVDQWGVWVSGFAPVYDKNGTYVASVGADISMDRYLSALQRLAQLFSIAFLVTLAFAFVGGHLLARRVTLSLGSLLACVREIGQGNLKCKSTLATKDEFQELGNEINRMTLGLEERERLKLNFARYVSQHVMEKILKSGNTAKLEGERRKITVLFSDIRQFTHLSEKLAPEEVVSFLNEYFAAMLDVIFRYQGTLDKFLGDGIMVEFGAPLDDVIQEQHAIKTALGMQEELIRLNAKWEKEGKPTIKIGVGIHTGLAVVGNIGSEKRIEYTAIGDTVNVASRLQTATKLLKTPILISEVTQAAIKEQFQTTCHGPIALPGRTETITVYSIDGENPPIIPK